MMHTSPDAAQPLIPAMRRMLFVASGLVFAVGIPLFLLTEQTDRYFAWTIQSPLTAAFLGAAYWSSCVLELLAGRERLWANARTAVSAVIVFTALTLVVTLIHLDKFHLSAPSLLTRAGTWVWLAIYALVPVLMLILLVLQVRVPGRSPARALPLPGWMRAMLGFNATIMVIFGVLLLLAPTTIAPLWPWALTPLTARAIGAWLVGLGIAAGQSVWENDLRRVHAVLVSSVIFSVLECIALARYPQEPVWQSPTIWVYILFLLSFLIIGGYGWRAVRRVE